MRHSTIRRHIEGGNFTRDASARIAPLADIIEHAKRQLGYTDHTPAGMTEPTARIRKIAGTNGRLALGDLLPQIIGASSRPSIATTNRAAGEVMTLEHALLLNSRCAQAGAAIVALPEQMLIEGTVPALQEVPAGMRIISPANFAAIALDELTDEGAVPTSALAEILTEAEVDRDSMTQRAFRVRLKRSDMRDTGEARIVAEVLHAIGLGLGRAIDQTLLAAILAAAPAVYSNQPVGTASAAAARGLRWSDLAAIVGTAGSGATVDGGQLYVGGVAAELTGDMTETLVGAFDRFGVVVSPDIEVLAERTDTAGGLTLTCWIDMQAMVPDVQNVWAVGA